MTGLFNKLINRYHYSIESIKNRYPCKVIDIKKSNDFSTPTEIKYLAATKINIRTATAQAILDDPLLVEKFHPTDGVKLGFLACGEILLKENISLEEARRLYKVITNQMFQDFT